MKAAHSVLSICFVATLLLAVGGLATNAGETADGAVVKHVLDGERAGTNVLKLSAWRPYESGFTKTNDVFICDNGTVAGRRGVWQHVELNQKSPQTIVASVWSKTENVSGGRDSDYSLYLDLQYADGTPLWGQTANFSTGTHDFERREVLVLPDKPVKSVSFYLLLRGHFGQASFRDAELRNVTTPPGSCVFDTVAVPNWQDFGFKFKEGNDEAKWDAEHGILTFRYTEPMTWWMPMPKEIPRTMDAARAEAQRLAEKGDAAGQAFMTSGFRDDAGHPPARMLDEPWCNGTVWSMNSMPGIAGEVTDFKLKWNTALRDQLYGSKWKTDLAGEYVDSSEAYVTDILDFRHDHFAAAETPLTFSPDFHRPAIYRGLIAFEYVRGIARDVHGLGKLMMANATPSSLCWLAPNLDVIGTETDWNPGGQWRPMSDEELLYRRALCRGKPYCFLMNTEFTKLSHERVEKYMERCLAYGMFPGFFSANAATGHYFERPELFERDRLLFKKYVPLCKLVAQAGWAPITRARASDETIHVERFGENYLTVFNDSAERHEATITTDDTPPEASRDLVSGMAVKWNNKSAAISLEGESVAVIQLR